MNQQYPCLAVLDAGEGVEGRVCGEPSTYHAKDNDAAYGHVCGDCWEALPEPEQELYVLVGPGAQVQP